MSKPDCYECKHRRDLLGDCHSRCDHPAVRETMSDPLAQILALMGAVGRSYPARVAVGEINVVGNQHGIINGWFAWPFNFDPTWLDTCDGFEENDD